MQSLKTILDTRPPRRALALPFDNPGNLPTYFFEDQDVLHVEAETPYVLRVRDMDDDDKPREKLMKLGPSELSMTEIVAILLSVGTRREEVMTMANRILREYGERAILQ